MPLDPACKSKLLGFVGYGPASPKFIFLGAEEGITGDPLVNVRARCATFQFPREDKNAGMQKLEDAYIAAGDRASANEYRDARERPGHVPVWQFAAMVTAALRVPGVCTGDGPWRTSWAEEYGRLGTLGSDTLLAELYPLPKPGLDKWYAAYTEEFAFDGFKDYFARVWPRKKDSDRRKLIAAVVQPPSNGPECVVAYSRGAGSEFWARFDGILDLALSVGPGGVSRWHVIEENRIEVAITNTGTRVARTGFPWSQHAGSRVTDADVPGIVNAIRSLRPTS